MGFVEALKQVLVENRETKFPEVSVIEDYSDRHIDESCYILIDPEKEEPVETGQSSWQAITRKLNIMIIKRIGKEAAREVTRQVESTGQKVIGLLKKNQKLTSAAYPEGFLIESSVTETDCSQSVNPAGSEVAYYLIVFQGSFFRGGS
jgi:hypothetical protein